jgi:hypothetical protein
MALLKTMTKMMTASTQSRSIAETPVAKSNIRIIGLLNWFINRVNGVVFVFT